MNRKRMLAGLLAACLFLFASCGSEPGDASTPISSTGGVASSQTETSSVENETSSFPSSEVPSEMSSEASSETSSEMPSDELPSDGLSSDEPSSNTSSSTSSSTSSDASSNTSSQTSSEDTSTDTPAYSGNLTEAELARFENCAFIGNSLMDGIYGYNIIPTADFYTRTSLNVKSVYTASTKTGKKPIMEMVDPKNGAPSYDKIFLLFGVNEPSYSDSKIKEYYSKIVQDLHAMHPNAQVYVLSVFPITRKRSDQNKYGLNNERINRMNIAIQEMCDQNNATYLDVHSKLADENGELPAVNASSDGVHFKKNGYAYIAECVYDLTFGNGDSNP